MRDYNWLLEYVDWWQLAQFQNRKRYGGMRDAAESERDTFIEIYQSKFQNRKRYGGMRDAFAASKDKTNIQLSFKTVNGMEACATPATEVPASGDPLAAFQNRKRYGGMRDNRTTIDIHPLLYKGFKTVNGMEACATDLEFG